MNDIIHIIVVIEDELSLIVLRKIFNESKRSYSIYNVLGRKGCSYIDNHIQGFNNASKEIPFVILRDLDKCECPPFLLEKIFKFPIHHNLIFRIVVREIEAWLLADKESFSDFLGISKSLIPYDVETIDNPKEFIITLAKKSKKRFIREDILPRRGAKQGPGYNACLGNYVLSHWNLYSALNNSESLHRTFDVLNNFSPLNNLTASFHHS